MSSDEKKVEAEALVKAKQAIVAALAELERATGRQVLDISLRSDRYRAIQDHLPTVIRFIEIEVGARPGVGWGSSP